MSLWWHQTVTKLMFSRTEVTGYNRQLSQWNKRRTNWEVSANASHRVYVAVGDITPVRDTDGNVHKNIHCAKCHHVFLSETFQCRVQQICHGIKEKLVMSSITCVILFSNHCLLLFIKPHGPSEMWSSVAVVTQWSFLSRWSDPKDLQLCSGERGFMSLSILYFIPKYLQRLV